MGRLRLYGSFSYFRVTFNFPTRYKKRLESANDSVGVEAVAVAAGDDGPTDFGVEQVSRDAAAEAGNLAKVYLPENASTGNIEEEPSFLHQVLLPTFKYIVSSMCTKFMTVRESRGGGCGWIHAGGRLSRQRFGGRPGAGRKTTIPPAGVPRILAPETCHILPHLKLHMFTTSARVVGNHCAGGGGDAAKRR